MMVNLEQILTELRSQTNSISDPIQRLSSFDNDSDENYTKLIGILDRTYGRLIDFLNSLPESPLFISGDPNFMDYLVHDLRNPFSLLITDATLIVEKYGAQLSVEQKGAAETISRIANDILNYLNTFV